MMLLFTTISVNSMELVLIGVLAAVIVGLTGLCSIFFIIYLDRHPIDNEGRRICRDNPASVMIIAGSGGHTSEILALVRHLGPQYRPRMYVVAATDKMSEDKILKLESERKTEDTESKQFSIHKVPRSREVKQSWVTTVVSTAHSCLYCLPMVFRLQPEVIICNGPGTCIPLCLAGMFLKVLMRPVKIVYVESICRVQTLSLSGKILYHFADAMFVQWPSLQRKYPKTQYIGRMV